MSVTDTNGNVVPYGRPVSGLIVEGPELPVIGNTAAPVCKQDYNNTLPAVVNKKSPQTSIFQITVCCIII